MLQALCVWMIVVNNPYQGAVYFSTASATAGKIVSTEKSIQNYFNLSKVNEDLAKENARLLTTIEVEKAKQKLVVDTTDKVFGSISPYSVFIARVVNNTLDQTNNFFTINKGSMHGITVGMGVLSPQGVAGQIKAVSNHYAIATSILNTKWSISAKLKKDKADCIVVWDAAMENASTAKITNLGRHHKIKLGDTIVTSGYKSALFPYGVPIGKIIQIEDDGKAFWGVTIQLFTDYGAMDYVYVINNKYKHEIDSLEQPFLKP
jgi:rod shape-determining protein MreC